MRAIVGLILNLRFPKPTAGKTAAGDDSPSPAALRMRPKCTPNRSNSALTADCGLTENISWWDSDAEVHDGAVAAGRRSATLWNEYLRGATESYRRHGVERALDVAAVREGADTAMFWATLDSTGRVIGGLRAKGPLMSPTTRTPRSNGPGSRVSPPSAR